MRFVNIRLVTDDVPRLVAFYSQLFGAGPDGNDDYCEFRPGGATLAIVRRKIAEQMHGQPWPGDAGRAAILEFEVADVDAQRGRLDGLVCDWIQQPRDMPWGNRSMLFRDPDGNPINVFAVQRARDGGADK